MNNRLVTFIRRVGWAYANEVGVIPFCAPENGRLYKIVQPFLRSHVFLCIPISIPQKRNKTEGINNKSNIIYYQNDDSDHSDNYQIWEEGYLLFALNSSVYLNKLLQN